MHSPDHHTLYQQYSRCHLLGIHYLQDGIETHFPQSQYIERQTLLMIQNL